jgi:type II secretion system protein N
MTPGSRFVRRIFFLLPLPLLFLIGVYFFFPAHRLEYVTMKVLESQRLKLSSGMQKTFMPGLRWEKPVLSSDQGALVRFDRLNLQPRLWPLLRGRMVLNASASLGAGRFDADYGLTGKQALNLHVTDIGLSDIPFFKTILGARSGGILWSEGVFTRSTAGLHGELKLEVKQLELSGVRLGAFPLPDVSNLHAMGMVRVTDSKAHLDSFTLQGTGVYMRLSGDLPAGSDATRVPLNLMLEIMPKPEFIDSQRAVFLLLAKFMISPGVYHIPIRGTLLKPEIM